MNQSERSLKVTESETRVESKTVKRRAAALGGVALALMAGVLLGAGTFTFGYGQGTSYLSNNPQSCANCHVMQGQYDSWQHSSHHHVATCNDCHLPHDAVGKWVTKADNGFFHSLAFTLGDFHDPIQIKPRNRTVTQQACIACHQDLVHSLLPLTVKSDPDSAAMDDGLLCVHCHSSVGHAYKPFSSAAKRE